MTSSKVFINAVALALLIFARGSPIFTAPLEGGLDNSDVIPLRPDGATIEELRGRGDNYKSPLFAYSELLEQRFPAEQYGNECENIREELKQIVPNSDKALCPYEYKCKYNALRYPRYIIRAQCTENNIIPGQEYICSNLGQMSLRALVRTNPESDWSSSRIVRVRVSHTCAATSISSQTS